MFFIIIKVMLSVQVLTILKTLECHSYVMVHVSRELNRKSGFDLKLKLALLVIYLHPWTFPYLAN